MYYIISLIYFKYILYFKKIENYKKCNINFYLKILIIIFKLLTLINLIS